MNLENLTKVFPTALDDYMQSRTKENFDMLCDAYVDAVKMQLESLKNMHGVSSKLFNNRVSNGIEQLSEIFISSIKYSE